MPTPARRAMSSSDVPTPAVAKASVAAAMSLSRLRLASGLSRVSSGMSPSSLKNGGGLR